jgi:PE-PPE domain
MARSGKKRGVKVAMSVAAVGVATSVAGVAATQPASISTSPVDLAALIVVGSSTNWDGAGVPDFFHGKFNTPTYTGPKGDDITYVNFLAGLPGIKAALEANAGEPNLVMAGGWGAANVGYLLASGDPAFNDAVVVMVGDVARPDGGFGTRYPWFSLIGVNPIPTPSDVPALRAVNTGSEYDYNSNAPADVLNPIAALNALVGYLDGRLRQSELDLPVNVDGTPSVTCDANTCAITTSGAVLACTDARCTSPEDRITTYVTTRGNTTYVTYTTEELPLTRLIRQLLGDRIANIANPLLKLAVDSAYYGGNPIPTDPSAYRPARLFPSPADLLTTIAKIPGAIQETLAAITAPADPAPESRKSKNTEVAVTNETLDVDESLTTSGDPLENSTPLTNVVRNSVKAVPGEVGELATHTDGTVNTTTTVDTTTVDTTDANPPASETVAPEDNSPIDIGVTGVDVGKSPDTSAEGVDSAAA